jgi:hypothetical protein
VTAQQAHLQQLQHLLVHLQVLTLSFAWDGQLSATQPNQQQPAQQQQQQLGPLPLQRHSAAGLTMLLHHSLQMLLPMRSPAEAYSIRHLLRTHALCLSFGVQPFLRQCAAAGDLHGQTSCRCCSCLLHCCRRCHRFQRCCLLCRLLQLQCPHLLLL